MHWHKTSAWWVIFRCQYTLSSNNQLRGCLNPPCLVLFSAVDAVAKHSSVIKTTVNTFFGLPKAFVSSAGILNLPITSLTVDNFHDRALWCKSTGINYNMHGWILCRYCATGWFWWISGLRAVTMWSSSSFTKRRNVANDHSPHCILRLTGLILGLRPASEKRCNFFNIRRIFYNLSQIIIIFATHIHKTISISVSMQYRAGRYELISDPLIS